MNENKAVSKKACAFQALPRSELAIEAFDCLTFYDGSAVDETWLFGHGSDPLVPVAPASVTNCNVFHLWLSLPVFLYCRSVEDDDRDRWIHIPLSGDGRSL